MLGLRAEMEYQGIIFAQNIKRRLRDRRVRSPSQRQPLPQEQTQ